MEIRVKLDPSVPHEKLLGEWYEKFVPIRERSRLIKFWLLSHIENESGNLNLEHQTPFTCVPMREVREARNGRVTTAQRLPLDTPTQAGRAMPQITENAPGQEAPSEEGSFESVDPVDDGSGPKKSGDGYLGSLGDFISDIF